MLKMYIMVNSCLRFEGVQQCSVWAAVDQ